MCYPIIIVTELLSSPTGRGHAANWWPMRLCRRWDEPVGYGWCVGLPSVVTWPEVGIFRCTRRTWSECATTPTTTSSAHTPKTAFWNCGSREASRRFRLGDRRQTVREASRRFRVGGRRQTVRRTSCRPKHTLTGLTGRRTVSCAVTVCAAMIAATVVNTFLCGSVRILFLSYQ